MVVLDSKDYNFEMTTLQDGSYSPLVLDEAEREITSLVKSYTISKESHPPCLYGLP